MKKYITENEEQTKELAEKIADRFKNKGGVISLIGDLGAGKTTFTQFFAQALGVRDKIISPTFVLHRSYQIDNFHQLNHVDLYRLAKVNPDEIGLTSLIQNPSNLTLIEWADKLPTLPKGVVIKFKKLSSTKREIEVY